MSVRFHFLNVGSGDCTIVHFPSRLCGERKIDERIMIVEISGKTAIDASRSTDPMRFTNHSCQANARLAINAGRIEFYSLRPIAPGEEITVNYGRTHHEGKLRCRCGAPGCVGAL